MVVAAGSVPINLHDGLVHPTRLWITPHMLQYPLNRDRMRSRQESIAICDSIAPQSPTSQPVHMAAAAAVVPPEIQFRPIDGPLLFSHPTTRISRGLSLSRPP